MTEVRKKIMIVLHIFMRGEHNHEHIIMIDIIPLHIEEQESLHHVIIGDLHQLHIEIHR